MAVLEDQCLAPGGADEKFVSAAYMALKGNQFLPGKVSYWAVRVYAVGAGDYVAHVFRCIRM